MNSYYIWFIVVFVVLIILKIKSNDIKGTRGEKLTENRINLSKLFGKDGEVLRNIYVPKGNGETSEIDVLFVTKKGIFVIESKNYSGYIFGSEENQKWTVTLYAGKGFLGRNKIEKHQFYNPIKQNKTHIKYLDQYLGNNYRYHSVIAFSERCEFKDISTYSNGVYVCHRNDINFVINKVWKDYPDTLSDDDINYIKNKLSKNIVDKETKEKHVKQIKKKFASTDVCPVCGGKLVLRTAKQGRNAGNQFYGCSNYPKCKYTKKAGV